jgi:hypothetical protein
VRPIGLDMYLYAERYVPGYIAKERAFLDDILHHLKLYVDKDSPHATVRVTVGYWRKANAIHSWFVENVQAGIDECQTAYVEPEQLAALRLAAFQALKAYKAGNKNEAEGILTPADGFFFGSSEVDDYYAEELSRTIGIIDKALKLDSVDFYYHSSW